VASKGGSDGERRAKGTGSISVLPDGRADAEYKVRRFDGTYRRLRKRLPSEEDAERWLLKVRYEESENALRAEEADGLTLGSYLDSWLRESVAGTVARHTQRDYEDKVRLHIKPALGSRRLADLATKDLNLFRRKLAEGLKPGTVRYMHATPHRALHEAEGADLVRKNVARWAKPPKEEHRELPVLTVGEAGRFLREIRGDRLEALYLLAVTTGLRRGELLGLKWGDADLKKGTLKVSRSLDTYYGPAKENAPKRAASRRPAVLPAPVVEALRRRKDGQEEEKQKAGRAWKETGYVFATRVGTPERGENVLTRAPKPLMERAGLPPHNFQALRRFNATFLVLLGMSPRVAMAWMGHSDVATTMRFYQQAPDELQEKAARLMGELLGEAAPGERDAS